MLWAEPVAKGILESLCSNEENYLTRTDEVKVIQSFMACFCWLHRDRVLNYVMKVNLEFKLQWHFFKLFKSEGFIPIPPVIRKNNSFFRCAFVYLVATFLDEVFEVRIHRWCWTFFIELNVIHTSDHIKRML